jgi:hypothetical protein
MSDRQKKIDMMDFIHQWGGVDGAHHKQWVLDQLVRIGTETKVNYDQWVKSYCRGEDGDNTYEWDEGIAP